MILKLLRPARLIVGKSLARCSTCGVELDCLDLPGLDFCCGNAWDGNVFYCSRAAS